MQLLQSPSAPSALSTLGTVLTAPCSKIRCPLPLSGTGTCPGILYTAPDTTPTHDTGQLSQRQWTQRRRKTWQKPHQTQLPRLPLDPCICIHARFCPVTAGKGHIDVWPDRKSKPAQHREPGKVSSCTHTHTLRQCPSTDLGHAIYR